MTIFFDCRFVRTGAHDGISRFSSELFSAASKQLPITAIISDLKQLEKLPTDSKYLLANDPTNPLAELSLARKLNRAGAEVVYCPMQTMGSNGRKYKLLLTLHDMIYYSHKKPPGFFSWPIKLAWRIYHLSYWPARLLLNRADHVVTVSNTSKRQIQQAKLTKRDVSVVYNAAVSPGQVPKRDRMPEEKELIYMGSFMDYKNVDLLVLGMNQLPEFKLLLLSSITASQKKKLLNKAGAAASRIVFFDGISDEEYHKLLDRAFALVSASLDEGFGIPLVEAMSRATPLVVSEIEIFKEVGKEAGSYFDPTSVDDFVAKVKNLENPASWLEASAKAAARSQDFDWKLSANQLVSAIQAVRAARGPVGS